MSKRATDHVVVHDGTNLPAGTMECTRCGGTSEPAPLPMPTMDFVRWMEDFGQKHAKCRLVSRYEARTK